MAFQHSTPYRFYIQRYPESGASFAPVDIEEHFNCRYRSMSGNAPSAVKNFYEEKFAERSGSRLWLPSNPEEAAFDTSELTLELFFKSNENYKMLEDEERFLEYITAKRFEYHDTFRPNRYWQLTFVSAPETKDEVLYGGQQYRLVAYKLKNWGGKYFKETQIK